MQDLIKQEKFELEVLERLHSKKLLQHLVFGGGTMLRLCYELNRFSVDLDFWLTKEINKNKLFEDIKSLLAESYVVKDATNKFYTIIFEIKSKDYPRSLKIEIRKEKKVISVEQSIAFSKFANTQVFLRTVSLADMMESKIDALLDRKEIRDAFDMEFLFKKGVAIEGPTARLKKIMEVIDNFTKKDYSVKLGSLLDPEQRKYYLSGNFKILKAVIEERLVKLRPQR